MAFWDGWFSKPAQEHKAGGEIAVSDPYQLVGGMGKTYNPSDIVGRRGLKLFDEMRRDEQIKAAMTFKKHAVVSAGWEVVSPAEQEEDWEVTEFVRETLSDLNQPLDNCIIEMLTCLDYGYSVTEKVYQHDGSRIRLAALKTRKPHHFTFQMDEYGNLEGLIQEQGYKEVKLPPQKFLVMSHQREFGNHYGRSDLEAAHRAYWTKKNVYRWMSMFIERFGTPPIFALYDASAFSGALIEDIKTVMSRLQASTVGAVPRGSDKDSLEMWSPQFANQTGQIFLPALDRLDQDIARALLMPGLLGITPEEAVGSQARAQVVFDVFMLVINQLREQIQREINNGVVRELVNLNYGGEEYPEFRLLPIADDDSILIFNAWKDLIANKVVKTGEDDEPYIRRALNMPERDMSEDEDEEEPVPPPIMVPVPEEDDVDEETFAQGRTDFKAIEKTLDNLEAELMADVEERLVKNKRAVIKKWIGSGSTRGLPKLRLEATLKRFMRGAFRKGREDLDAELGSDEAYAEEFAEVRYELGDPNYVPADALRFMEEKALHLADAKAAEIDAAVKQAIISGMQQGYSNRQIEELIEAAYEPYLGDASKLKNGEALQPHRVAAIARTEATAAYNQGRLVEARRNSAIIRGMRFSAVLDDRTTEVCRSLNGTILPLNSPDLDSLRPPRHVNCRSILVPVTITETVTNGDIITPAQAGRAKEQSGRGF